MPRYTLRLPNHGELMRDDGGTEYIVADSLAEARELYSFETGDPRPMYMHPVIANCRVVYKADVDNGDCHEDAEPGDTTWTVMPDRAGDLHSNEVRMWAKGAPTPHWSIRPVEREPIAVEDIPVGANIYHRRHGWGQTTGPANTPCSRRAFLPVRFSSGVERNCAVAAVSIHGTHNWPPPAPRRIEVAGEVVCDVQSRWAEKTLLDLRLTRLRNEWEAEQFDEAALVSEPALA